WIAVPVAEETFQKLSALFVVTQPRELGTGRDAASYSRAYSNLKLRCAWRIEHQSLWDKYVAERNDVIRHLRQLERSSIETPQWRSKLEEATVGMPDELCAPIGERYLLHGTKPEVLLDILHQGFNDKLASLRGMFGAGAYFAEDPEKIDQYTREDPGHEAPGLERLHSRLYRAGGHQHPGDHIFYCFVVRVTCGACFLSHGFKDKLRDHDSDFQVFVNEDRRELSAVPGSDPRIPYHTLVVQTGKEESLSSERLLPEFHGCSDVSSKERFREVISFSANRAYPETLRSGRTIADLTKVSTPGYLAGRQDRIAEIEKSLSSTAEQLARARNLFQSLREDEEAEAATTTTRGQPPAISLQDAAEQGDVAALAAHRQAGSDLNAEVESEGGWTAAHWAALRGQTAALKFLHEAGANLSATDRWGSTPVLMALEGGTVEMLEALVEAGVDLNVTDNGGNTPAILVADGLDHTAEKLLILLKAGADLEKANQRGRTPAHVLAERGEVDALRVLIQAGVNLNAPTPDGYTAADIAALNHHEEALKLLLKAGAARFKV
ncbi:unnamed protein product, partial [Symbiodinium sp. KB8]